MRSLESAAIALLKIAVARPPDEALVNDITARELASLAISSIGQCPVCGATAWVNIDCELCAICSDLETT
jgi:hypothetical protein